MRWCDPAEVRALVPDGSWVALGGAGLSRKPMGLLRALVAAGVRDLRVVAFLGSVDVELLLAAGAVAELHTAGVALDGAGLAPRYRRARQEGSPTVVEWSEGTLLAAVEATARGVGHLPCTTSPRSAVVARNPWLKVVADPFTGAEVTVAGALPIDVALLHVPAADPEGNLVVAGDLGIDGELARAAGTVVVSCARRREARAADAAVSRVWVDALVHLPSGAWPTACHPEEAAAPDAVRTWAATRGADPSTLSPEAA
jgi:glutaconate CoA-transferase subunit A